MNRNNSVLVTSDCPDSPHLDDFSRWTDAASAVLSKPFNVHFIFVDEISMAIKNANLRNKFGPTDIISFVGNEPCSGSIYFCLPFVIKKHPSIVNPLPYLTIHGLLHLASYDHKDDEQYKEMLSLERKILKKIGLQHPEDTKND